LRQQINGPAPERHDWQRRQRPRRAQIAYRRKPVREITLPEANFERQQDENDCKRQREGNA
jgi:hypothetical protein